MKNRVFNPNVMLRLDMGELRENIIRINNGEWGVEMPSEIMKGLVWPLEEETKECIRRKYVLDWEHLIISGCFNRFYETNLKGI